MAVLIAQTLQTLLPTKRGHTAGVSRRALFCPLSSALGAPTPKTASLPLYAVEEKEIEGLKSTDTAGRGVGLRLLSAASTSWITVPGPNSGVRTTCEPQGVRQRRFILPYI